MPSDDKPIYQSLCMNCVWRTHPLMLTGYCIKDSEGLRCDGCGYVGDLAITKQQAAKSAARTGSC